MSANDYSNIIVTMEHCRYLGYCSRGVRALFDRYGLNYREFLRAGIQGDVLLSATNNDAMCKEAVEVAANGRK